MAIIQTIEEIREQHEAQQQEAAQQIASQPAPVESAATVQTSAANIVQNERDAIEKCIIDIAEAGQFVRDQKQIIVVHLLTAKIIHSRADFASKAVYESLVDKKRTDLNITIVPKSTFVHKLANIAFQSNEDADARDTYAVVYVTDVLFALKISATDALKWMADKGGIQKIRTTYNRNGSKKLSKAKSKTTQASNAAPSSISVEDVRNSLAETVIFTVPSESLKKLAPVTEDTECTAIVIRRPDGSLVIKAIVVDTTVTEAAYTAYATSNVSGVEQAPQKTQDQICDEHGY